MSITTPLVIAGLGNPGADYVGTRHNVGFWFADCLARRYGFPSWRSRYSSEISEMALAGRKVFLLKPLTFMNRSGRALAPLLAFYKLTPDHVLVVHDDLDLKVGQFRIKTGGGAGGHNGLKSLDQSIGAGYHRLRIGIDRPPNKQAVQSWVLGTMSAEERGEIERLIDDLVGEFLLFVERDGCSFANRVHSQRQKEVLRLKEGAGGTSAL